MEIESRIEAKNEGVYCYRCGQYFPKRRGHLPISYAALYKGVGHIPYCRDCIDAIYNNYLDVCRDEVTAARQVCRKLDLYWSPKVFERALAKSGLRSVMIQYVAMVAATNSYLGKSYDDTLIEENVMWVFPGTDIQNIAASTIGTDGAEDGEEAEKISDEVIAFWGSGYTASMYLELERRRKYYMSRLSNSELDIGTEILIRQICNLEVSIARDSVAGKPIDKSVNSLNTLLGSLNLKPAQKKEEEIDAALNTTPLGVWLYRYENKRPLPEIDDGLKDSNHLKKYIFTWMGHLCKMMGVKNGYTKLYEEEVERLKVAKPEYDGDDEEALLSQSYSEEYTEEE